MKENVGRVMLFFSRFSDGHTVLPIFSCVLCSHVLQTPPAIPTLMVAVAMCVLRGSKLIVDYHNYAYTMMSLSLGKKHPLVYITR